MDGVASTTLCSSIAGSVLSNFDLPVFSVFGCDDTERLFFLLSPRSPYLQPRKKIAPRWALHGPPTLKRAGFETRFVSPPFAPDEGF